MAEVIRVSRDSDQGGVIYSFDGKIKAVLRAGEKIKSFDNLSDALAVGGWRRPTAEEKESYALNTKGKTFRVPLAVQRTFKAASLDELPVEDSNAVISLSSGDPVPYSVIKWIKDKEVIAKSFGVDTSGNPGFEWASKFENEDSEVPYSEGFTPSDDLDYYAVGMFPENPENVMQLIAVVEEDQKVLNWVDGEFVEIPDANIDTYDAPSIIEISDEDAAVLAQWIDSDTDEEYITLTDIDPEERNLFDLADSEIDWEEIDRLNTIIADATGYSPIERSNNATRQQRAGDGKFGGPQAEKTDTLTALAKARLPHQMELLLDPATRIDEYLASEDSQGVVVAAAEQETETETEDSGSGPLYFAIVDPVDTTAVLATVAIVRGDGEGQAWVRSHGEWVLDPEMLIDLRGDTPPPVVELTGDDLIKSILSQIDDYDNESGAPAPEAAQAVNALKVGYALPDGTFNIETVEDLTSAIPEADFSLDARRHVLKRAKALNRFDRIPDTWKDESLFSTDHLSPLYGEFGEITAYAAGKGNAETLRQYWSVGKGAAKIRWGTKGDLTRCHRQLNKYMPGRSWGYCQNLHQRIFGMSNAKRDKGDV